MTTESIPQLISDLATKADTTNQSLAAIALQLSQIAPSQETASLDALAAKVAALASDIAAVKQAVGLNDQPPAPPPAPTPTPPADIPEVAAVS